MISVRSRSIFLDKFQICSANPDRTCIREISCASSSFHHSKDQSSPVFFLVVALFLSVVAPIFLFLSIIRLRFLFSFSLFFHFGLSHILSLFPFSSFLSSRASLFPLSSLCAAIMSNINYPAADPSDPLSSLFMWPSTPSAQAATTLLATAPLSNSPNAGMTATELELWTNLQFQDSPPSDSLFVSPPSSVDSSGQLSGVDAFPFSSMVGLY